MKMRVDVALTKKGITQSREQAQALIMAGQVYIDENKVLKPSEQVTEESNLILRGQINRYASRGYHKLDKAISAFHANVQDLVCMDIGAASGGFTDVLLRNGAKHVYAIDVGYGQLDWRLRNDERVTVMERTNARTLTKEQLPLSPTLTVMDVSFISIKHILPTVANIMGDEGRFMTLIKPQFEAGKGMVGKNGVIRDKAIHEQVLWDIVTFVESFSWQVFALTFSPITGPKGNIEFLADIRIKGNEPTITKEDIAALVDEAHTTLKK